MNRRNFLRNSIFSALTIPFISFGKEVGDKSIISNDKPWWLMENDLMVKPSKFLCEKYKFQIAPTPCFLNKNGQPYMVRTSKMKFCVEDVSLDDIKKFYLEDLVGKTLNEAGKYNNFVYCIIISNCNRICPMQSTDWFYPEKKLNVFFRGGNMTGKI